MEIHYFDQEQNKAITIELLKVASKWTAFKNCMGSLKAIPLLEPCRILQVFSKMVSVNVTAFFCSF